MNGNPLQITCSEDCISAWTFRKVLRFWEPKADDEAAWQKLRSSGYDNLEQVRAAFDGAFVGPEAPDFRFIDSILSQEDAGYARKTILGLGKSVFQPLFRTETGRMGRGPPAVAEGDLVCYLEGVGTPYLLRKLDDGEHYFLIGSCYVNGYSNDEPLESLRKGELSLKPFYVR